jgi:hypothetical protein
MSTRTFTPIAAATWTLLYFFTLLLSAHLHAGGRRRAVAVPPPSSLSLTFVDGPVLDTGSFSYRGGREKAAVAARSFAIRIGEPGARGTATLRAFLETAGPDAIVRVDGIVLTTTPRVIRRHVPLGTAVAHRLEVEVPVTAPDGPLNASIGWEATTE